MPGYLVRITLIMAFVQFINALEYMIFNPLFAWMAPTFQVPVSQAGYVTGIYTLASVIAGVSVWRWVGNVKPQRFLLCNMALLGGLTIMTLTTTSFSGLLFWRFLAGLVGGTTMGVGSSLLVNIMPAHLRPRALASTIAAFSLVSIVGMPTMLFLSEKIGWQIAPATIGGLCLIALPLIKLALPEQPIAANRQADLRWSSSVLFYASGNALAQFSAMLIIPLLVPLLTAKMGASGDQFTEYPDVIKYGGGFSAFIMVVIGCRERRAGDEWDIAALRPERIAAAVATTGSGEKISRARRRLNRRRQSSNILQANPSGFWSKDAY
ncbi:MFS transporter [Klebsiella oxytoca]